MFDVHSFYKLVQALAESAVGIGHGDKRVCLVLDDGFCARGSWVDDTDYAETSLESVFDTSGLGIDACHQLG